MHATGDTMKTYEVNAHWDPEARVWWAESNDVPGLVCEAETVEIMFQELSHLVPELLSLNGHLASASPIPFRLIADRAEEFCAV
jgi:predicted RNase H-like HicB family nuclease